MRIATLLSVVLAGAVATAAAEGRTAPVYFQAITSPEMAPVFLADITYEPSSPIDTAAAKTLASEVTAYEPPEVPDGAKLLRIGVYDRAAGRWQSSTSVLAADNFSKGYSPHFILTVDEEGEEANYLGVACRGVRIDAGHTRDFGPQVVVRAADRGKQPELNKPVVLSPEGRKVEPLVEKTFLQKYNPPPFCVFFDRSLLT